VDVCASVLLVLELDEATAVVSAFGELSNYQRVCLLSGQPPTARRGRKALAFLIAQSNTSE
jgi:hypothetical protein